LKDEFDVVGGGAGLGFWQAFDGAAAGAELNELKSNADSKLPLSLSQKIHASLKNGIEFEALKSLTKQHQKREQTLTLKNRL
jgi:hypothetical protein